MHSSTAPVSDKDIPKFRWFFFAGWVVILGILPGFLWKSNPIGPIWWPIAMAIISLPLGYFLGYRRLIGPLFSGFVLLREGMESPK